MKSIRENFLFNLLQQAVIMMTPLITAPYTSRVLGAEGIGRASYASSVCWYFVLVSVLGSSVYGQRETAALRNDREKLSQFFWNAALFRLMTAFISAGTYILLFSLNIFSGTIYLILTIEILNTALDFSWFFQGLEEFRSISLRNIFVRAVNIASIFIFVKTEKDLNIFVFITTATPVAGNLLIIPYIKKYIGLPSGMKIRVTGFLKKSLVFFIPAAAVTVYTVADKTMIGLITGSSEQNGWYEFAFKISRMGIMAVTSLGTVLAPRIASLHAEKKSGELKETVYKSVRFAWAASLPLSLGLALVSSNFIPWFLGEGYEESAAILTIMSFIMIPVAVSNVTGTQYLIGTGREKIFTVTVAAGSITNIAANLALIPLYKAEGAAAASVLAESVIAGLQLIAVRKELNVGRIFKAAIPFAFSASIMACIIYIMKNQLESSFPNTAILGLSGAALYGTVLLIIFKAGKIHQRRRK